MLEKRSGTAQKSSNRPPEPSPATGELIIPPDEIEAALERGGLTDEKREIVLSVLEERFHQGPLPSVETFSGYEQVCPGSASEIVGMAKAQLKHQTFVEKCLVLGEVAARLVGISIAAVVILGILGATVYLALHDKTAVALALAGIGFTGLASTFINFDMFNKTKKATPQTPPTPSKQSKRKGRR